MKYIQLSMQIIILKLQENHSTMLNRSQVNQVELSPFHKRDQYVMKIEDVDPNILSNVKRLLGEPAKISSENKYTSSYSLLYMNPMSKRSVVWSLIYLVIFYMIQMQISLSIGFGPTFLEVELQFGTSYKIIYIFFLVFLVVDVVISFHKGYYAFGRGRVIDDHKMIVRNYVRGQFILDAVAIVLFVIPLFVSNFYLNYLQLVPAVCFWIKKFKYQEEIVNSLQYQRTIRTIFMLVILFVDVLMIGNYGACLFVGMDRLLLRINYYGQNSQYYWLSNNTSYPYSLVGGLWYVQYVYAQQFSTGTLSTLAPGPFAKNPIEILYAIVVMIFFMILASYVGEVLISIVYTQSEKRIFHEENIQAFDNFMQLKNVSKNIRDRIYNFFELIWEVEIKMESQEQEAIINKLPNHLKEQLLTEMGFAHNIYFLKNLPHQKQLQKLISLTLRRVTVDSDTCIFLAGHYHKDSLVSQNNLYFIKEGMAKFYLNYHQSQQSHSTANISSVKRKLMQRQKIVNLSNVQRMLGVYQFVTGQAYSYCCKSIDLCLLQKITFIEFVTIIQEVGIKEQFQKLKYEVLIERRLDRINKKCIICLADHIQNECPDICFKNEVLLGLKDQSLLQKVQERTAPTHKRKRNKLKSKKLQENAEEKSKRQKKVNLINLFKAMGLGKKLVKMFVDLTKMDELDAVNSYDKFYPDHNLES